MQENWEKYSHPFIQRRMHVRDLLHGVHSSYCAYNPGQMDS